MGEHKIFKIIGLTSGCFLVNITFIDGFLYNLFAVLFLKNEFQNIDKISYASAYKHQAILSLLLVVATIYLIITIFSKDFFVFKNKNEQGQEESCKSDNQDISYISKIFLFGLPLLILIFMGVYAIILLYNNDHYAPNKYLYHDKPKLNQQKPKVNLFKSILKKAKKKLFSLSLDNNLNDADDDKNSGSLINKSYTKIEDLPWQILELNDSQYYHSKYKYYKHMLIIALTAALFLIMLIRFNFC